jgi:hypothetical protein
MIKHPIIDSHEHRRRSAALADRYLADQQRRERAGPQASEKEAHEQASSLEGALSIWARIKKAGDLAAIVVAGLKASATAKQRMAAHTALDNLTAMAKRDRV